MEKVLDLNVCRDNWMHACTSPNLDVGVVINRFAIFSTALVNAKRWAAGNEKAGKKARLIMKTAFPGKHDVSEYAPLPCGKEEDGNIHHYVTESIVADKFAEMGAMALTPENIEAACIDLQAIARMYAEGTIDAAKTGAEVVIENIENLKKLQAKSKLALEVTIDWNKTAAKVEKNTGVSIKCAASSSKKVAVEDIFHELRLEGMKEVAQLAKYLSSAEQCMPEEVMAYTREVAEKTQVGVIELVRKVKKIYMSLAQIRKNTEKRHTEGITDEQVISQIKKAINPAFDAQFEGLRNMLRVALSDMDIYEKVALCLYVTYDEMGNKGRKGADAEVSKFVQDLLDKEFFLFIMGLYDGDDAVCQYTEDALIKCHGYEDGDVAEFVFGEAEDDGKYAMAKEASLEGEYIIRKNREGKFVASRKVADSVEVPAGDPTQITFVTKMKVRYSKEAELALEKALIKGAEVQLVPYDKAHNLRRAVLINGVRVAEFQNDTGDIKQKEANDYFDNLHAVKGKLVSAVYGIVTEGSASYLQAVVTIGKCVKAKTVENYNGTAMIEKKLKEVAEVQRAERLAKRKAAAAKADSSYRNCEDALPGLGAPAKKKVAPKKVASTLPGLAKTPVKKAVVKAPAVKKSVAKAAPKKGRVKPAAGKADAILI